MNIYDEAIKNVKSLDYLAEWYESDVVSDGYEEAKKNRETMTQNVIKTLERAKKVEELVGLYKKECKMVQRYINGSYQPMGEHLDNIKQIKALEKELEELK